MSSSPAFQFYPADFTNGAPAMMSPLETHVYMWLMCLEWDRIGVEYDESKLAHWCRIPLKQFRKAWPAVRICFTERGGRFYHPRLEKEREKQQVWREKSAKGGRTKKQPPLNHPSVLVATIYEPEGNTMSSSSSSTSVTATTSGALNDKGNPESAYSPDFDLTWQAYPKRAGSNSKKAAYKAWKGRLAEGEVSDVLRDGTLRFNGFCVATGKVGTEFVMQGVRFYGPDKFYSEPWDIPAPVPGSTTAHARNPAAEQVWELCKRYGFHHCTKSTIDGELARAHEAGDIDDTDAFKAKLRKLDLYQLKNGQNEDKIVASIAERLAA